MTTLLAPTKAGDAHLVVGLLAGLTAGTPVILAPQTEAEERGVVHSVMLRNDGLVVLLRDPVKRAHSDGAIILVEAFQSAVG